MENFHEEISSIIKTLRETTEQLAQQNERFKAFLDDHGLMTEFESLSGVSRVPGTEAYHREVLNFLNSCKDNGFSEEQLEMLKTGISNGLGLEGIVHYADKTYSVELMDEIRLGLLQTNNLDKLPGEYRELLKDIWREGAAGVFNKDQISVFREMIVAQYPLEDIKFCRQPKFNYATLRELSACLKDEMYIRGFKSYKPGDIHATRLAMEAVKRDGWALRHIPKELQTEEICVTAMKNLKGENQYRKIVNSLNDPTKGNTFEWFSKEVDNSLMSPLPFVAQHTIRISEAAMNYNGMALKEAPQMYEICEMALEENIMAIRYVKKPTEEMLQLAEKYRDEHKAEMHPAVAKMLDEGIDIATKRFNQKKRKEKAR